jgi:hypothetical protein
LVRSNNLPRRAILEPDEHFIIDGVIPQRQRESLINAALSRVWVYSGPDGLARLRLKRQHVPV